MYEAWPTRKPAQPSICKSKNRQAKAKPIILGAAISHIVLLVMTGQSLQLHQNAPQESSHYKCFKAMNNRHGVRHDMEALCKFVRETLFYAMIHDARGSGANPNDEIMGENGKACQIFIHVFLRDKERISNVELIESTPDDKKQYLKFLWKEGLQAKGKYNIRKALSNEKSAVYAGISECFKSKSAEIQVLFQTI